MPGAAMAAPALAMAIGRPSSASISSRGSAPARSWVTVSPSTARMVEFDAGLARAAIEHRDVGR